MKTTKSKKCLDIALELIKLREEKIVLEGEISRLTNELKENYLDDDGTVVVMSRVLVELIEKKRSYIDGKKLIKKGLNPEKFKSTTEYQIVKVSIIEPNKDRRS